MTYYYSLTRTLDEDEPYSTTTSVSDRDPINCAHMLAAVFNTMNGFIMPGWVLGVVDTKAGTVQYQGKVEKLDRPEPAAADERLSNMHFSKTFNFEGSPLGESLITFFGEDNATTYIVRGDVKADGPSKYAHVNRDVLEDAYAELQAVKDVLADAGVETIPADRGVKDLRHVLRARDEQIAELEALLPHTPLAKINEALRVYGVKSVYLDAGVHELGQQVRDRDAEIAELVQERANRAAEQAKYESGEYMPLRWESLAKIDEALRDNDVTNKRLDEGVRELGRRLEYEFHARTAMERQYAQENEAARAELIAYVKRERAKWHDADKQAPVNEEHMNAWFRGVIDLLAKFLVVTGEADASEGHAVARRLCGISDA